jgi:hypothetical protein
MLTTNAPLDVLAGQVDLFLEVQSISVDLTLYEQWHGPCADVDELRQRIALVLVRVLGNVFVLLSAAHTPQSAPGIVH